MKGSVSRRYVQPGKEPAGESEVYLDENFLERKYQEINAKHMLVLLLCRHYFFTNLSEELFQSSFDEGYSGRH